MAPAAVLAAVGALTPPACLLTNVPLPAAWEVGNDDSGTADENNDPYAGGGVITSTDDPTRNLPDAVGAVGDAVEMHLHFREFARVELNGTWWRISPSFPWRVHFRARKLPDGTWHNNGSDAALDNAGF
jgi:hypothetical protein